jgi:hypothetical protein
MKTNKLLTVFARGFILLSAFCFLSVGLMAFVSPQAVMDLVKVNLGNTDAISSIRGVYGGVGLTPAPTCSDTDFAPSKVPGTFHHADHR